MKVKDILDEDFCNYKKPSMFIIFPNCTWKCEKECGVKCCQNGSLAQLPNKDVDERLIIYRYLQNPITQAIVCGGLEPIDSWNELAYFIGLVRQKTDDDIVIYTGYTEEELKEKTFQTEIVIGTEEPVKFDMPYYSLLSSYKNIIVKFGRYKPNNEEHIDEVLGVKLASDNQYGKAIGRNLDDNNVK